MSEKRKRDGGDGTASDSKRQKRGFQVGPQNLPDGTYRRKTQKIKQGLIDKAKLKKEYAKLKKHGQVPEDEELPKPASLAVEEDAEESEKEVEPPSAPHPDRQTLMNKPEEEVEKEARERQPRERRRKPKTVPFKKEHEQAQKRKAEAEERRRAREEAERQRQQKIEERERFRKAMAKARTGGKNGQRKLGRESKPLLERVKRLVGESG